MGITKVTAAISDLTKSKPPHEALFLVDTGAIHCMAPKDELVKAGIESEGKAPINWQTVSPMKWNTALRGFHSWVLKQ